MNKKIIITLTVIVWALYTLGNASMWLNFSDINIQSFQNKFSFVQFIAPGNNFVGNFFWLPSKSVTWTKIILNNNQKTCTKLVRGLYFNSQRGNRIRPLDKDTLDILKIQYSWYNNLEVSWGLYTTCDSGNNYGIFWAIIYSRWGIKSYLIAGTKLNYTGNKIVGSMANSFQYFDNKIPIGYIYDSNGGIGYVGGKLTGHENLINFLNNGWSINSGFIYSWKIIVSKYPTDTGRTTTIESWNNAMETMRNLIIQWSVGLSKSINEAERLSLLGNLQNKTVIYNGSEINSSTLINSAKQKAQELCQGKDAYIYPTLQTTTEDIICVINKNLTINLNEPTSYENKTIIVRGGNVILSWWMTWDSPSIDIFIDKWILYLPKDPFTKQFFDNQWFPNITGINFWLYLKGNFIINGLIIPAQGTIWWFNHKLHLQGKITTLNTALEAGTWRILQIENILWSEYNDFINLQNVFVRECKFTWTGSDGTPCNIWGIISTTPLVILNGNYPSNIIQ